MCRGGQRSSHCPLHRSRAANGLPRHQQRRAQDMEEARVSRHQWTAAGSGVNGISVDHGAFVSGFSRSLRVARRRAVVPSDRGGQALGQALYERGFDVLAPNLGFTRSHTLAVRVVREGGGEAVSRKLTRAGIITNKNLLPGDTSPKNPGGVRLGTPEVTRVGMKEKEMVRIAELFDDLLHKDKSPESVQADAERLKAGFTTLQYCFGAGEAAYRYYDLVGRDP